MKYSFLLGLIGVVGLAGACGDDKHATALPGGGATSVGGKAPGVSGKGSGGSSTNSVGGDDGLGGAISADGGLTVTISAPTAAKDPNVDAVIVTSDVTAVCSVVSMDPSVVVDGSSVMLEVLDATGEPAMGQDGKPLAAVGAPTKNADEYSAEFPLTTIETGVVSFRCSAKSLDKTESGTATLTTLVDRGPKITIIDPVAASAHPLIGVLPVEFTVEEAPLADGDDGAAVTAVNLEVAGVAITDLTEDPPGHYTGQVDFMARPPFKDDPPEHTTVHVDATNSRMPAPVKAVVESPIVVDGREPVITYVTPLDNAAVHGDTKVVFTIEDTGAGVDVDTLEISVTGQDTVKYDESNKAVWARAGSTFTFHFNASGLKDVISQVTIAIRVKDLAGNGDDKGETRFVYKDDQPPTIDLDPGAARGIDGNKHCSNVFDPLGDAVNDGATVSSSVALFRVLVYDRTNDDGGAEYFAGANQKTATLYLQPDPTKPFLTDKTGDGICDDILNADALPYQSLLPVPALGKLDNPNNDANIPPLLGNCPPISAGMVADRLCSNKDSDLRYSVQHPVATPNVKEPVVYAMGAVKDPECTGSMWSIHSVTSKLVSNKSVSLSPDGWICLAARAEDVLQNKSVSRPLRVCYDDPLVDGVPACANGGTPPPSCTDGCTPPPGMPPAYYY